MVKVNEIVVKRGMVNASVNPHQVVAADGMRVEVQNYVMPIDGEVSDITVWGREIKADGHRSRFVSPEGVKAPENVIAALFGARN
jgi:hypothetical protein